MTSIAATAQTPAFPGAEGHGRYVTGGRGGEVRHVTTLADGNQPGTFRWAVNGSAKKIVVFDVGGVIALNSDVTIGANTTIEGQTAPAPGITLRYRTVQPSSNCIVRFIRFRRGQEKDVNDGADATWQRHVSNLILDHCSMSWSIDELASFYDNNSFTMQWCMLGEGLANAGHGKGAHSYGGIWGGKLASFHHNFLGFVQNRAPRFNGARYDWNGYTLNTKYKDGTYTWKNAVQAENVDFRNCVMYNWGDGNGCYGGPGGGYINIVNNYYKAGPGTKNKTRVTQISVGNSGNSTPAKYQGMTSRYYINGNYVTAATNGQQANYDWKGVLFDSPTYDIDGERYSQDSLHYYGDTVAYKTHTYRGKTFDVVKIKLDNPGAPEGEVTTHDAETAYNKVLAYAGVSNNRDDVDARYVSDTQNGTTTYVGSNGTSTPGIIDLVSDCNGYTEATFDEGSRPEGFDTDGDGMPDEWETANGLDPNDPSDAITYTLDNRGWYTNVEVYCNSLVEDIMKAGNADAESAVDEYYPTASNTNGISGVKTSSVESDAPMFNLSGQRVSNNYKGIVFQNGRKIVRR